MAKTQRGATLTALLFYYLAKAVSCRSQIAPLRGSLGMPAPLPWSCEPADGRRERSYADMKQTIVTSKAYLRQFSIFFFQQLVFFFYRFNELISFRFRLGHNFQLATTAKLR